ncbi:MAG TPA: NUDIX domain-containing protein [Eudoraea sp.]|nr:NUDIX domain-containing protein [Eudoraea sp.]
MKSYNPENFIQQLSIDCVIFGYSNRQLKVLVSKLDFKGDFWVLPSGFILKEEGIDQAAHRILQERTGLNDIFLEQYKVFGDVPRNIMAIVGEIRALNPKKFEDSSVRDIDMEWLTKRFISIGYYALVDINKVVPKLMEIDQSIDWYDIDDLPSMIGDLNYQVTKALEALRLNLDSKLLGFNLLPETFTMKELQHLYETVYDRPFRRNNFQKKMLDLGVLERLEKKYTGASNKAPYLYRFMS